MIMCKYEHIAFGQHGRQLRVRLTVFAGSVAYKHSGPTHTAPHDAHNERNKSKRYFDMMHRQCTTDCGTNSMCRIVSAREIPCSKRFANYWSNKSYSSYTVRPEDLMIVGPRAYRLSSL